MAKALITGGAGFIGSHVVERFLAAGYAVEVLDDLSKGVRANVPPHVTLHALDIRSGDAAALVRTSGFDVIAHLAAQTDVRASVVDPLHDAGTNILGSVNLLDAVRTQSGQPCCRYVFVSTGGTLYGEVAGAPSSETTPANPDSPYGVGKLAAEHYAAQYGRVHGLDVLTLRLGNVYGPRQDPLGEAGVVAIFCGRIAAGLPLTVFGDGEQVRDYVYVGDVAEAVLAAARRPLPPAGPLDARAFNIGTGAGTSVLTLAQMIGRVAGVTPTLVFESERLGELRRSVLDVSKAAQTLGWRPTTALEAGLAATYGAVRSGR